MKQIFSNGDEAHVEKVIKRLGLEGCFDETICFETLNQRDTNVSKAFSSTPIICKPQEIAFEVALKKANINPTKTVSF